jgi:hypothetical protein
MRAEMDHIDPDSLASFLYHGKDLIGLCFWQGRYIFIVGETSGDLPFQTFLMLPQVIYLFLANVKTGQRKCHDRQQVPILVAMTSPLTSPFDIC